MRHFCASLMHTSALLRLAALSMLLLVSQVWAAFPTSTQYSVANYETKVGWFSDKPSACESFLAVRKDELKGGAYPWTVTMESSDPTCKIRRINAYNNALDDNAYVSKGGACPANSTKVGNECICDTDHAEMQVNGKAQCVPKMEGDCNNSGLVYNSTLNDDRSGRAKGPYGKFADGAVVCFANSAMPAGKGCKHFFTSELGFKDDQGQDWTNGFSFAFTQQHMADPRIKGELSCDLMDPPEPGEPETVKPNDKDCKDGYKGSVNGQDVCIEAWTGETQGVDFGITKGPDGTTTNTKNNINCKGDQCTVTETNTIKDADGNTIKETTSTTQNVNRQAYCAKNPQSSVCGRTEDQSGATKGQGSSGGGGGKGGDSGELDDKYKEVGAPNLYEKQYQGGIKGVWDKHAADLKNSSIGGLAGKLFPNYGDGGSAPTYVIDLNLGGKLNLGTYDLNFDPRVWLALKAFTILCALAVARRLVFGG